MARDNSSRDQDRRVTMLHNPAPRRFPGEGVPQGVSLAGDMRGLFDLASILAFLRTNMWTILLVTVFCMAIGAIYAFTAPPRFTAQASLVIDHDNNRLSSLDGRVPSGAEDVASVATQMQIIGSQRVALAVVKRLNLAENESFSQSREDLISEAISSARSLVRSLFQSLASEPAATTLDAAVLGSGEIPVATPAEEAAARRLRSGAEVRRAGASYVIEVAYTSTDPHLSAAISNALTQAYIADRRDAQYEASGDAAKWMEQRISELRQQVNDAARAAQVFRVQNNLVRVGSEGELVNEQQLSQLNTRLVQMRSELGDARARLEAAQGALESDTLDIDVIDAKENPLIARLREQYVAALTRIADIESRYGPEHQTTISAREELERLREAVRGELRRTVSSLRTNFEVAQDRVAQLESELNQLVSRANVSDEARVQLQQLETIAQSYRATHESYLKRYTEIIQQQSAPVLETRVISPASVPTSPSAPRKGLVLVLSTIFGGAAGLALAIALSSLNRSVRLPRQLAGIGLACLAVLPNIQGSRRGLHKGPSKKSSLLQAFETFTYVERMPVSDFVIGLHRAKTALKMVHRPRPGKGLVIGITSAAPREGKSTVASNLAHIFARSGDKALLIDADMHHADITRYLLPESGARSSNALSYMGVQEIRRLIQDRTSASDLTVDDLSERVPSDLLGSEQMRMTLLRLRETYDVIILDLAPVGAVPDANAVAPFLDGIVLVCSWGQTPLDAVATALDSLQAHGGFVIGAILNKADFKTMRTLGYHPAGSSYMNYASAGYPLHTPGSDGMKEKGWGSRVAL